MSSAERAPEAILVGTSNRIAALITCAGQKPLINAATRALASEVSSFMHSLSQSSPPARSRFRGRRVEQSMCAARRTALSAGSRAEPRHAIAPFPDTNRLAIAIAGGTHPPSGAWYRHLIARPSPLTWNRRRLATTGTCSRKHVVRTARAMASRILRMLRRPTKVATNLAASQPVIGAASKPARPP